MPMNDACNLILYLLSSYKI